MILFLRDSLLLPYAVFKVRFPGFSPGLVSAPLREWSLVGSSGLEPPTSRLSGARSNQLSYEPTVVEMNGFEPMASCVQGRRSPI